MMFRLFYTFRRKRRWQKISYSLVRKNLQDDLKTHIFPMREDFVYALFESLLNFESSLTALVFSTPAEQCKNVLWL